MLQYDKDTDSFKGVTSKYLPLYQSFVEFWDTTIVQTVAAEFQTEIEIDEICSLFKTWSKKTYLSEDTILKFLKHFFPLIEIVEDKYLLNIQCNLWDKIGDINHSLHYFHENIKNDYTLTMISFDDMYNIYQGYCSVKEIKMIVSKRYFEKYLSFKFASNIVYDKFINVDCL